MTTPATISAAIDAAAREGKRVVTVGKTSVESMPVSEMIAADKYAKAQASGAVSASAGFGIRFGAFKPGGPG